jgi:hypothetical protein
MPWRYVQNTGCLFDPHGKLAGAGYSGHGQGMNNHAMETVRGVGPLPCGSYTIGDAYDDAHLGPCVMHLDANSGTDTHGRSLFRMHGDNSAHNHSASDGCLIFGPDIRNRVADDDDDQLVVVADEVKGNAL